MKIDFTSDKLWEFLEDFRPLCMKYFGRNDIPDQYREYKDELIKITQRRTDINILQKKTEAEELVHVYKIAEKVYASEEEARKDSDIYKEVMEKFVGEFVGIEGIEDLFDPQFFVFEWMMHLEYKPESNSYSYYRDHFIHQVRNMFEMIKILADDSTGILDKCINEIESVDSQLSLLIKNVVEERYTEFNKEIMGIVPEENKTVLKRRLYRYILLASSVVTALVHDIGYPVAYISKNLGRMENFLPVSLYFFDKKNSATQMHMLLQSSWLYKLVDNKTIADRINDRDHGAISAIILLAKFYMDGRIYLLPKETRLIIELSAIAIYEHTLKYKEYIAEKEKFDLLNNLFETNPFSFLFRLCDDIEEWDRVYFDITKQSNFLICDKCKTVIGRMRYADTQNKRRYACCCGYKGVNENLFKYTRLAYVNASKKVSFEYIESDRCYLIDIDYDLSALLQAAAYNVTFAVKRAEALQEIKKMMFDQKGLYPFYIQSFISNNPIAIKVEIVRRYMARNKCAEWDSIKKCVENKEDSEDLIEYIWSKMDKAVIKIVVELQKIYLSDGDIKVNKFIMDNTRFYLRLAILVEYIYKNETTEQQEEKYVENICEKEDIYSDVMSILLHDVISQAMIRVSSKQFSRGRFSTKEKYFKMFEKTKNISLAVENYIQGDLYDHVRDDFRKGIQQYKYDFFSDYWLFNKLNATQGE